MINYDDVSVCSNIEDRERLNNGLKNYLNDRVWSDEYLLTGFTEDEIAKIIDFTIEKYGNDINKFVAVCLEQVVRKTPLSDIIGDIVCK